MASNKSDSCMIDESTISEDNNEDVIVLQKIKQKPNMTQIPKSKLFNKTQSLLTQIKRKNEEITKKINKMGKESVIIERTNDNDNDDGKNFVNLDLFLGILEEKKNDNDKLSQIQSTTDKLLGINQIQNKKSIIIEEIDQNESTDDEDIDL